MQSLAEWRTHRLMGVKALAQAAGVSNRTIIDIEHGRTSPKYRTIKRISEALQVDPLDVTEFAAVIKGGLAHGDRDALYETMPEYFTDPEGYFHRHYARQVLDGLVPGTLSVVNPDMGQPTAWTQLRAERFAQITRQMAANRGRDVEVTIQTGRTGQPQILVLSKEPAALSG